MWNAFTAGFEKSLRDPPRYVDELPTEIITPLIVPTNPALAPSLSPMSGAALSDGSLVIGMNIAAAVIDPWFRLIGRPGGDQVEKNNYNLAARIFTTPADMVYLIPPSGRAFYRVVDGVPGSLRTQIGNDVSATPIAVLHDCSVIQKSISTSDVERFVGRERSKFSLATGNYSHVTLIATGPEGNLWAWDQVERRVKIFSPNGVLLDSVVAIHAADNFLSPQALIPYPDGSFLLLVAGGTGLELKKFKRDGRPEWVMNEIASDFPESIPYNVQPVVDATGQNLYLVDFLSKRIIKLYDASAGSVDATMDDVLDLNDKILEDPYDTAGFAAKAKYYEEMGAAELAQATWQRLLEVDPYDSEAASKIASLESSKSSNFWRQPKMPGLGRHSPHLESSRPAMSTPIRFVRTSRFFDEIREILRLRPGSDRSKNSFCSGRSHPRSDGCRSPWPRSNSRAFSPRLSATIG